MIRIDPSKEQPFGALPNACQMKWHEMEWYAFIHFTVNTYTNLEWGLGNESEDVFNPVHLDCDQWCRVLSEAGCKGAVLTAKHHDGFCLWPSKYTDHCVRKSKWRDGKGDVVAEFVAACRKYGLKVGLYLSPWDRHEATYGSGEAYNEFYRNQLKELLTTYGGPNGEDIFITWFDGACGEGPNGKVQHYDFDGCTAIIHKYAPNAVIFGHMGDHRDIRWCGNESGFAGDPNWATINAYAGDTIHNGQAAGKHYWPSEVDVSIRPGWYYHDNENPHSLERLLNIYFESVGRGSCLNLNVPPNRDGVFSDKDIKRLQEMSGVLKKIFSVNFCSGISMPPCWTPAAEGEIFDFGKVCELNIVELKEYVQLGQRIAGFRIDYLAEDGSWQFLCEGTTVGHRRLVHTSRVKTSALRLKITDSLAKPVLCGFGAYYFPPILFAPHISHNGDGLITITSKQEAVFYYTTDGSQPSTKTIRYTGPFYMKEAGTVRALAVLPNDVRDEFPELKFNPESMLFFGMARTGMSVIDADSEYDSNNLKENIMLDGEIWISGKNSDYPHYVTVDTGREITANGFLLDEGYWHSGLFARYQLFAGNDPAKLDMLISEGVFDNIKNNPIPQRVELKVPVKARYFKLVMFDPVSRGAHSGRTFATVNSIEFF